MKDPGHRLPADLAGGYAVLADPPLNILDIAMLEELRDAIAGLNEDEVIDVIALVWVGRGDYSRAEWGEARRLASIVEDSLVAKRLDLLICRVLNRGALVNVA